MNNSTKKFLALLVSAAALTVVFFTVRHAVYYAPDAEVPLSANSAQVLSYSSTTTAKASLPARLSIPSLGIDASVQYVGIKANGNMATPNNFTDVGWFKYGAVPGSPGAAVMAGHVDNGLSLAGVFKHLSEIQVGADVYVTDKSGQKLHFVVTDIESYPYQDAPADKVFKADDGAAHLNLITCTGGWVQADKTYNHRLVVFTKLVS